MDAGARSAGKAVKKVVDEFGLQIADQALPDLGVDHGCRTSAKIDRCQPQGFIHGHQEISGAQDPPLRSQRLVKSLAQNDAYVFHRVVLVHVEIALGAQLEVEASMPGE